ncbi:hypothetical protein CEUSTIGMA_g1384.t1 [Chlamydomonas eustigma]|uniref:Uncharacterized protein n=1 Tax=Chlamydomonas eustigma TaxID=1157962 RepID=A0A250WSX2_9CHLO|nr:hypothetical protein CEUSTIGMA_g1384.t1 [Chlamydomonas eustigma]|eukprot:GAX73934.1 hypothetical protein CEUSTIGMA_g1384.t1 [Chlamydomonas eustigma]
MSTPRTPISSARMHPLSLAHPSSPLRQAPSTPNFVPQLQDPTRVAIVHVRPGSEYQALMYLLRRINKQFGLDEVMPELPDKYMEYEYRILNWPDSLNPHGDASTYFGESCMPVGLLLKRVRVKPIAASGTEFIPSKGSQPVDIDPVVAGRMVVDGGPTSNQIKALRRQMQGRVRPKMFDNRPSLMAVAVPGDPLYLRTAAAAIKEFNAKGLTLTVYMDITVQEVAAASLVQAAWRSHNLRGQVPLTDLLRRHRAALVIQRAWKRYLVRHRFVMLSSIKRLVLAMSNLLLGGTMTMDVHARQLLYQRAADPVHVYPESRLRFVFDKYQRVHVVVPDGEPRVGLPRWLGALVSTMTQSELSALYGDHPVYDAVHAIEILKNGAEWRICYIDLHEARSRACLLLALTFDPKPAQGVTLLPPHLSSLATTMERPSYLPPTSSLRPNTAELNMHRWFTVNSVDMGQSDSGRWKQAVSEGVQARKRPPPPPRPPSPTVISVAARPSSRGSAEASPKRAVSPASVANAKRSFGFVSPPKPGSPAAGSRSSSPPVHLMLQPLPRPASPPAAMTPISVGSAQVAVITFEDASRPSSPGQKSVVRAKRVVHPGYLTRAPSSPLKSPIILSRPGSPGLPPASPSSRPGSSRLGSPSSPQRPGSRGSTVQPVSPPVAPTVKAELPGGSALPRLPSIKRSGSGEVAGSKTMSPSSAGAKQRPPSSSTPPTTLPPLTPSSRGSRSSTVTPGSPAAGLMSHGRSRSARSPPKIPSTASTPEKRPGSVGSPYAQSHGVSGEFITFSFNPRLWNGYDMGPTMAMEGSLPMNELSEKSLPNTIHSMNSRATSSLFSSKDHSPIASPQTTSPKSTSSSLFKQSIPFAEEGRWPPETEAEKSVGRPGELPERPSTSGHSSRPHTPSSLTAIPEVEGKLQGDDVQEDSIGLDSLLADFRPLQRVLMTPNTRLLNAIAEAEAFAHDPRHMVGCLNPLHAQQHRNMVGCLNPLHAQQRRNMVGCLNQLHAQQHRNMVGCLNPLHAQQHRDMRLLPIGHVQHSTFPLSVRDHQLSRLAEVHEDDLSRLMQLYMDGDSGENPELYIKQKYLYHPAVQGSSLDTLNAHQASMIRHQRRLHEAFIAAQREEVHYKKTMQAHIQSGASLDATHDVWVKHHDTSHIFAPGYIPLTAAQMSEIVAAMTQVYMEAAAEKAHKAKEEHSEVMREIKEEKNHLNKVTAAAHSRQVEVTDTMRALYNEAWEKSKQARVNQISMRKERKRRQAHERSFAQAFVRQTNLLARHMGDGERALIKLELTSHTMSSTATRRAQGQQSRKQTQLGAEDAIALNRWKAQEVKRGGFTEEVQEYTEELEQYNRDVVSLKRMSEFDRKAKVGPAGGLWGNRHPTLLRDPLPMSSVVPAHEAKKQHRRFLLQQRERVKAISSRTHHHSREREMSPTHLERQKLLSQGGEASLSRGTPSHNLSPRGLSPVTTMPKSSMYNDHHSGLNPSDRFWLEEDEVEESGEDEEDDTLTDYLPELPYSKGAVLRLSQRDRPTGIVV